MWMRIGEQNRRFPLALTHSRNGTVMCAQNGARRCAVVIAQMNERFRSVIQTVPV
ncbi:hypothetical protein KCP77_03885 [Salmonella enterica subsp. enterica]|nr:hypothetical protein KCP77_03885 [Salmonella enterica subsp. enterica]